jgi:hypothetical protein
MIPVNVRLLFSGRPFSGNDKPGRRLLREIRGVRLIFVKAKWTAAVGQLNRRPGATDPLSVRKGLD